MTESNGLQRRFEKHLVFGSGGQAWALPLNFAREIIHVSHLLRPPGAPSFFAGFLNVSGQQIAVLRLAALLSLPERRDHLYTPILLLKDLPWALLLEEMLGMEVVATNAMDECPSSQTLNGFVSTMFEAQGKAVYVLDLKKLLVKEEEERLRELSEQFEQRLLRCQGSA